MSKSSDSTVAAGRAAICFWVGCQPIIIGYIAYLKFILGDGEGYEAGVSGFVGGAVLMGVFSFVPTIAFFIVVFIVALCFRREPGENNVGLFAFSAFLGLLASLLYWRVMMMR